MKRFKYQVAKGKLIKSVSIRIFRKEGEGRASGAKNAELLMEKLNNGKLKFAAEELDSTIEIFTEEAYLED